MRNEGKSLTETFYCSQSDLMLYNVVTDGKLTVPDCQSTFPLDFSIYTFEHLRVSVDLIPYMKVENVALHTHT